jgi:hypothetical protein
MKMIGISVVLSLLVSGLCWAEDKPAAVACRTPRRGSSQCYADAAVIALHKSASSFVK